MPSYVAACNIVGPNGELVVAADPDASKIPEDWPQEFIDDLLQGGAIVDADVANTVGEALEENE